MTTLIAFLFALGVLVFVHELGHYLVARWCGVKILRFSIGFGKPLLTWKVGKDQTEWSLSPIPLGGYVRMLDEEEGGEIDPAEVHRAFNRLPLLKRSAVVIAGPAANFLLAIVAGIGISIFSLARLVTYLLVHQPVLVWAFFFGLVLASTWFVSREVTRWDVKSIAGFVVGAVAAWFITVMTPAETPSALWFIFLCGAIAICAMILPGISGSFILVLLGKYFYIMEAVKTLNLPVMLVQVSSALGTAILAEAALSYLGVGTQPSTPTWGRMLYDAQKFIYDHPAQLVVPAVFIATAVLGFNLLGDGLRELLDPRLRQED